MKKMNNFPTFSEVLVFKGLLQQPQKYANNHSTSLWHAPSLLAKKLKRQRKNKAIYHRSSLEIARVFLLKWCFKSTNRFGFCFFFPTFYTFHTTAIWPRPNRFFDSSWERFKNCKKWNKKQQARQPNARARRRKEKFAAEKIIYNFFAFNFVFEHER